MSGENQKTGSGNAITEGVIWRQLLYFFFPILLGTFFQQLYNTIDMIVVGRFVGTEALASVGGSASQIVNLIIGFFTGLSGGAGVIISQFYGARDPKNLNDSIHTTYAFSLAGGAVFMVVGILSSPFLLSIMNTQPELIPDSLAYLRIYFGGIVFTFIYNVGSAILRALGDSKRPLYYLIVCSILNIILDLLMVVVLHLGVPGVAIATVVSQAFSALLVTAALMKPGDLWQLQLKKIRIHKRVLGSQLYVGLPGGFQSVLYGVSNMVILTAVNIYGTATTAAYASYGKLDAIFWMVSGAFGVSITTFVGQNFGAKKFDRIEKSARVCLIMDLVTSAFISTFLVVFRRPLFAIFTSDAEVTRIGTGMVRLIAPSFVIFAFIEVLAGALRGMSDVIIPTLITLMGTCAFRVVWILFIAPLRPSLNMIMISYPVSWIVSAILFVIYYSYRKKHPHLT